MAEISQIRLPSGTVYDIKDATARAALASGTSFLGVTTTALTDGAKTASITVGSDTLNAINGGIAIYGNKEFIFSSADSAWHEIGDTTNMGDLAWKDSASGTYTPGGTVSQPTFTGDETTSTGKFTPAGSVTVTTNATTNKTATVSAGSGTATYTPEGSVAAPTISVATAGATATVKNPTSQTVAKTVVAAAPGATAPANAITYYAVSGEVLSLYQLGYTTGDSITTSDVTVKTGDAAYSASAPEFTGTGVHLVTDNIAVPNTYTATFTGTENDVSVKGTPTGTVSQPTFTGTQATITVS